jgi:Mechanosensitive ion channel, conserved TM helix
VGLPTAAVHIAKSLQQGLDSLIGFIPNIIGFLVILIIGYVIARLVKTLASKALEKFGLDRALHDSQAGQYVERLSPGAHPSRLIGAVAFWFIFLYAIAAAVGALKIPALTNFMANVQNYLPNVIAAVLIFVAGAVLAGAAGGVAHKLMGDTPTGRVARTVGPGLILAIVVFMVLTQLKIAPAIVEATYVALIGMLALAGALAFGLGGRDVAADMLHNAYGSARDNRDQVRRDLQTGRDRAQAQADRLPNQGHGTNSESAAGARRRI